MKSLSKQKYNSNLNEMNNTTYTNNYNNKSFYNKSFYKLNDPFHKKSISQIKRDKITTNRTYIETMYKSGNLFKYKNITSAYHGNHKSHLWNLETKARSLIPEINFEKNRITIYNTQSDNLRAELKYEYKNLKKEMNDEVNILQIKLIQNINKQKTENIKINKEIKYLNDEFIETKNKLIELKQRVNYLKTRIDGSPVYNINGIPVLNTKIE